MVGREQALYYIHRDLLLQTMPSLRDASGSDDFRTKKRIDWSDKANTTCMDVFVGYLYKGLTDVRMRGVEDLSPLEKTLECYKFARAEGLTEMRDKVIKAYREQLVSQRSYPGLRAVAHLDAKGFRSTPLRQLVFDTMVYGAYMSAHEYVSSNAGEEGFIASTKDAQVSYLLPDLIQKLLEHITAVQVADPRHDNFKYLG